MAIQDPTGARVMPVARLAVNVAFRVDASINIGTGHVMRCLTLADALVAQGAQCYFISREHPGNLFEQIRQRGHQLVVLPICSVDERPDDVGSADAPAHAEWLGCDWRMDAEQTRRALDSLNIEWLVVDHYAIDANWERALAGLYRRLLVIDDLADRLHVCDLLLDQTLGRQASDYKRWVPEPCKLLLGTQYALLRPEFAELREYSLERRKSPQLQRFLVTMGGVDKDNVTGLVLTGLERCVFLPDTTKLTVVMGPNAPWLAQVKEQAESLPWEVEVLVGASNMATLMSEADLAIGAAGSTSWERCCLGVPTIMLTLADNQRGVAHALESERAVHVLPDLASILISLPGLIAFWLASPQQLKEMSLAASTVTDGTGVQRLLGYLGV